MTPYLPIGIYLPLDVDDVPLLEGQLAVVLGLGEKIVNKLFLVLGETN